MTSWLAGCTVTKPASMRFPHRPPRRAPTRGRTRRRWVNLGGGPGAFRSHARVPGPTPGPGQRRPTGAGRPPTSRRGGARPGDALPVPLTPRVRPREEDCGRGSWGGRRCGWCRWPGRSGRPIRGGAFPAGSIGRRAGRSWGSRRGRRRGGGAEPQRAYRPACPPPNQLRPVPRPETGQQHGRVSRVGADAGAAAAGTAESRARRWDGAEHLLDAERHRIRHRRLRSPQPPPIATTNHEACYHSGLSAANRLAEPCPLARRRSQGPPRPHGCPAAAQLRTQAGTGWLTVLFCAPGLPHWRRGAGGG